MRGFALEHKRSMPARRYGTPVRVSLPSMHIQAQRRRIGDILRGPRFQAKLTVGAPDDAYEREADRVADRVMRMPGPKPEEGEPETLRRQPVEAPEEEEEALRRKTVEEEEPEELRRQALEEEPEEETFQAKAAPGRTPEVTADLASRIQALKGGGQPLPESTRAFFEPRFGHDFGDVRIHTDAHAAGAARAVNACAFTVGKHVMFGAQQYAPETNQGKRLLAHELTHTVQQTGGTAPAPSAMNRGATSANGSETGRISRAPQAIQRQNTLRPYFPMPPGEIGTPRPIEPGIACVQTTGTGAGRTSNESFRVYYEKTNINRGEISLRERDAGDRTLHKAPIPATPKTGDITIPSGIAVAHENHRYELEMVFFNTKGKMYGGLGKSRPPIQFEVCRLDTAPTGDDRLFAKAIYAEGVDASEFPHIRDLVFNRIQWVASTCPGDAKDFGTDVRTVLNAPRQFASVLGPSAKFTQMESELTNHSGPCQFTTPPRPKGSGVPSVCRLINAAIRSQAAGNGNTHDYVFFRSDTKTPSTRAVNRWRYPKGNYYWEISECPPDRRP